MRQEQAVRFWLYISKPFQITKVLEILYMLDWLWYAILSFLPERYIAGSLFVVMRNVLPPYAISIIFTIIAILHLLALYKNNISLRKFNLILNIGLLLYLTGLLFQNVPVAAGIGYYVILIGVSIFAFWRMDESH